MGVNAAGVLLFFAVAANAVFGLNAHASDEKSCASLLSSAKVESKALDSLHARFEVHTLRELTETNSIEANLAFRHPSIVMDAAQIYLHAIVKYPRRLIADPTYPVRKYFDYPIFSSGVPEADGAFIVGQFEAINSTVDYISNLASGKSGNTLMLVGPGGTGKTELLIILDRVVDRLSVNDPNYYEYTFRWKNLDQIPYLEALVADKKTGALHIKPLQRSPLTLLPKETQERIVAAAKTRVNAVLGLDPNPFLTPDPQSAEILNAIVSHYKQTWNLSNITEEDYIKMLEQHVDIVRRLPDPSAPPGIVRFQGKHPEETKLFFSENIYLMQVYGSGSALSYNYNGAIPRRDGRGIFLDELYRNDEGLLNTLLEVFQNNVAESGGAPALTLNSITMAATNDEQVEDARKRPGSKASLDRVKRVPMRQTLNPVLIAELAVHMSSPKKLAKTFKMRALDSSELKPASLVELWPVASERGEVMGPAGRYALYWTPTPNKQVLIAPHALELLAMTVAGTRFIRDPEQIAQFKNELSTFKASSHYYTNVQSRLDVILKKEKVGTPLLIDLARLQQLLREGEGGISARDAERWLSYGLSMAENADSPLTPAIMDRAFSEMIDNESFVDNKNELRARWIEIESGIKNHYLLKAITEDVQNLVGGESGLKEKLYEEIQQELMEVAAAGDKAEYWIDSNHNRHPINKERLARIFQLYQEINGQPFTPGIVKTFEITNGGQVYEPLMRVIQKFVVEKEFDTAVISSVLGYFDGKPTSAAVKERAMQIEATLAKFGYDRSSFRQALRMANDLRYEINRSQKREP